MSNVTNSCTHRSKRLLNQIEIKETEEELDLLRHQLANKFPFLNDTSENFELVIFSDATKGFCVKTRVSIPAETFILEYRGDILRGPQIRDREKSYQDATNDVGCFMFHFKYRESNWCVDGTKETKSTGFGRYLNHSCKHANLKPKIISDVSGFPHIVFYSTRNIKPEEELLFDYGEKDNEALCNFPWLKE